MLIKIFVRFNAPKPKVCWNCDSTDFVWQGGEWICEECGNVQSH